MRASLRVESADSPVGTATRQALEQGEYLVSLLPASLHPKAPTRLRHG
jgi:hypothetical protein